MDAYEFIKESIQTDEGIKDLISNNYIEWALEIIKNEKLVVSDFVLEYLNNENSKIKRALEQTKKIMFTLTGENQWNQ
jgi:hypothetical protein